MQLIQQQVKGGFLFYMDQITVTACYNWIIFFSIDLKNVKGNGFVHETLLPQ